MPCFCDYRAVFSANLDSNDGRYTTSRPSRCATSPLSFLPKTNEDSPTSRVSLVHGMPFQIWNQAPQKYHFAEIVKFRQMPSKQVPDPFSATLPS
jgi:hypothetical protein